jgi:hypothetical protein
VCTGTLTLLADELIAAEERPDPTEDRHGDREFERDDAQARSGLPRANALTKSPVYTHE